MKRYGSPSAYAPYILEDLENRCLLSWGAFPQLIHQDVAIANFPAITGAGYSIVDIDSGVDAAHPNLAGKISTGLNLQDNSSNTTDNQGHGTMTAGLMAASLWTSPSDGLQYQGVAPAQIIPLKVTDSGASSTAFDQAVGRALYYTISLVQNHPEDHIEAVNLSLRAVKQANYAAYMQKPLKLLHNLGVFVAAASGNDGNVSAVDWPANDPYTVAVGGVNADDTVTTLTNRSSKIGLLAPGNGVPSLQPGARYTVGGDGTSYATPFVTAAAVLVKQADPAATPDQIASILTQSGDSVSDPASGLTFKRLNLNNAIALALQGSGTGTPPASGAYPDGVPHEITAGGTSTIQVEDFDNGGQGVGYYDLDKANRGGLYRNTRVDILSAATDGGGYQVFSTKAGEWLDYTVQVDTAGNYAFSARVASYLAGGTFHLEVDGADVSGSVNVANTRGWAHWRSIGTTVALPAGQHVLRLMMDRAGSQGVVANFNWIAFAPASVAAIKPSAAAAPLPTRVGADVFARQVLPASVWGAVDGEDASIF